MLLQQIILWKSGVCFYILVLTCRDLSAYSVPVANPNLSAALAVLSCNLRSQLRWALLYPSYPYFFFSYSFRCLLLYGRSPSPTVLPLLAFLHSDWSQWHCGSPMLEPSALLLLTALLFFRFLGLTCRSCSFLMLLHWKHQTKIFGAAFIMWVVRNSVITWSTLFVVLKAEREKT